MTRPAPGPLVAGPHEGQHGRVEGGIVAEATPGTQRALLDRNGRRVVALVFVLTGAASLLTQITWQRVIALHAGVDLASSTLVVAAFLGGLGLGTLIGGRWADRLGARRALTALAGVNAAVAAWSTVSVWLLYDLYRALAPSLEGLGVRFGFNALVLLVPTVLQGLTLPLVAKAVTESARTAGSTIGRFNAANTIGAALGAFVGGWVLLGRFGFTEVTRLAALAQGGAAVVFLGLSRAGDRTVTRRSVARGTAVVAAGVGAAVLATDRMVLATPPLARFHLPLALLSGGVAYLVGLVAFVWPAAPDPEDGLAVEARAGADVAPVSARPTEADGGGGGDVRRDGPARSPWRWYLAYGATGAVALGFEQVLFRLVDGVMRSNSYTFAHVLSLYLVLLGLGGAVGSWWRPRVHDDRRAFLWLQFGVGLSAVGALVLVTRVLPQHGLGDEFARWFNTDGFSGGFEGSPTSDRLLFGLGLPLVLMGLPVLCMGAAFPFVQGLVTTDLSSLGRRTGGLVFANLVGNVTGALVTGFVLIDRWGTVGAYRALALPLVAAGLVAAGLARSWTGRSTQVGLVAVAVVAGAVWLPSNDGLWATLHGTTPDAIDVAEDRSCASALERYGDGRSQLTINGAGQNGHPFDDFHVLIGLLPALVHDGPVDALAIGLGIGSTSYAALASERTTSVTSVELCGGNYELVDLLAAEGIHEFEVLRDDPRHRSVTGDGRRHLVVGEDRYDVIVPDTVRPNSAGSGNLYSREFQELVSSRLADGGLTSAWIPTYRALNAVTATFPYVVSVEVRSYNGSELYLASHQPIELDRQELLARFDALPAEAFGPEQRDSLRAFLADLEPECLNDGEVAAVTDPRAENRDLHPRDEYFIANGGIPEEQVARTCGP